MLSVCPSHLGYSDNKLILDQNLEGGEKKKKKRKEKKGKKRDHVLCM